MIGKYDHGSGPHEKFWRNFIGANVRCISNVKKFNSNPIKYSHDVKKALVFGFERKSKVGKDFVQIFSCGPLP